MLEELAARSGLGAALGEALSRDLVCFWCFASVPVSSECALCIQHRPPGACLRQAALQSGWHHSTGHRLIFLIRHAVVTGGRDAQQLVPLLAHLQKHIVDPRHANLFIGILNRVLDAYGPAVSSLCDSCTVQQDAQFWW